MSRDVRQYLTYCFRKNAKLKQSKEYLSKATIIDLRYNFIQEQLKKISGLSSSSTNTLALPGEITVKTKQTNQLGCDSDSDTEELLFAKGHNYNDHRFIKSHHYAKKKSYQPQLHQRFPKDKNLLDSKVIITRCSMYESVNRSAPDCAEKTKSSNDTWLSYKAILFQSDLIIPEN